MNEGMAGVKEGRAFVRRQQRIMALKDEAGSLAETIDAPVR